MEKRRRRVGRVTIRPRFFADVLQGLVNVYVLTLRLITGRRRPDYSRIAELEVEFGFRSLDSFKDGSFPELAATPRRGTKCTGLGVTMVNAEIANAVLKLKSTRAAGGKCWSEGGRKMLLRLRNLLMGQMPVPSRSRRIHA
jgi:hypothetical protein